MPVEFLTQAQKERHGRFIDEPSPEQLARHFHFDDIDHTLIARKRGAHNRLGFAIQLGTVRHLGAFLLDPIDVPRPVITYVGRQLHLDSSTSLLRYLERKQTRHAHCAEIRKVYGYHDFSDPAWRFRLSRWLYARTWLANERPGHLFDLATHWLRQRKVLLPGATTLTRLISQIRERASVRTWRRLAALPNDEQCAQLEALLEVPDGERRSLFDRLRRSPRRISSAAMRSALQRYRQLRHLGIRGLDFSSIPPGRLKALARYAATGWAPSIARMPDERRRATLVAFAYAYEAETLDDALDLLDLLITDIAASAKRRGVKKRLRTLEDLDKAALELADVCSVLLDEDCPDSEVRTVVFAKLSKEHLTAAVATTYAVARPPRQNHQPEMLERYQTVRRFLPHVLETVTFRAATAGKAVLEGIDYLARPKEDKGRSSTGRRSTLLTPAGNAWSSTRRAASVSLPIRCACWRGCKTACGDAISMCRRATVGATLAPSCCAAQGGEPSDPSFAVPWDIPCRPMQLWNGSGPNSMPPTGG